MRTPEIKRVETRRAIRSVLGTPATLETICQSLPHLARGTIAREVNYLRDRQALVLVGYGRGSRYVRQEVGPKC